MTDQKIIDGIIDQKLLQTTSLVSLMSPLQPLIETYEKNGEKATIAFMVGLPIPFNIFLVYFTAAYITYVNSSLEYMNDQDRALLYKIWESVELSKELTDMIHISKKDMKPEYVVSNVIAPMFTSYASIEKCNEAFRDMVYRLDQDYTISLSNCILV